MHATFRQMQLMLALAETGSVTGAARHCHVTQPTASMQLKELSDAIGLPLYERVGQRLHLTQAGEAAAQTARAIAAEWEALEQRVAALKGVSQGRLRIALASTAKYFIPRMLGHFCAEHPAVDVSLQVLNRDGVVQRLLANEDDLYILSIPPRNVPHDRQVLLGNPLVVIAAQGHPLAARRRVRLEQLLKEPFILRETGSGTRLATDEHFKALGFAPRVRLELGSNEAIKQSVAARMGLGLVSRHALAADPASEGVAIVRAEHMPVPSSWYVLWPQGKRLSPIAENFLRQLLQQARGWEVHS